MWCVSYDPERRFGTTTPSIFSVDVLKSGILKALCFCGIADTPTKLRDVTL